MEEFGLAIASIIVIMLIFTAIELIDMRGDSFISNQIDDAIKESNRLDESLFDNSSYIQTVKGNERLTEKQIQEILKSKKLGKDDFYRMHYWNFGDEKVIAASAAGTERDHHFVNAYLVGYEPFKTEHIWIPHYAISMRLRYQLDSEQYGNLRDVWQNSKQAFLNTRGDCEDHALVLADWLIEMGLDARVVIGKHMDEGHAWVVVFKESEIYLLEATDKRKRKHWKYYPLAKFAAKYHPSHMFNRDYFWVNTGSIFTTNYSGENWAKRSRFFSSSEERVNIFADATKLDFPDTRPKLKEQFR